MCIRDRFSAAMLSVAPFMVSGWISAIVLTMWGLVYRPANGEKGFALRRFGGAALQQCRAGRLSGVQYALMLRRTLSMPRHDRQE